MSTKDEALRMALEALEELWGLGFRTIASKQQDAITAIREALALSESSTKCEETSHAQPEQEPFGYFRYDLRLDAWVQNRAGLTGTPFYTTPQPAVPDWQNTPEFKYATSLVEAIFRKHYANDEPYASGQVAFEIADSMAGMLTQIDNMTCRLVREDKVKPAVPERKPLSMQERTSIVRANKSFHDKNEIDAYGIIDDVEAAHGIKD